MISIIIPNYNGEKFLTDCLHSIQNQTFIDYEVIVVDNASTDQSVDLIRHKFPGVTILENHENRGYAGGANNGILSARGEYLLILNTDTILSPDCLSELYLAICERPEMGMYAPRILYPDAKLNAAGSMASVSGSSWERGKGKVASGHFDTPCEVFGPYGAAALFCRKVLEKTGGFDEDFFLFVEETDLSFRARLAGYRCWYVPSAIVTHYHGATAGRTSDTALYYLHRNTIWYVFKDYPFFLLVFALPWIFGRNLLSVLYYSYQGRGELVIQAKIDALRGLPGIIRKRKKVFQKPGRIRYYLTLIHPVLE